MKEEKITITNAQELRQEKCNVPTLRFKQFQDNWSSKRLSDIAEVVGGGTPDTTDSTLWNGGIQWFTPTEVGHSKYVSMSVRTISQHGLQKSSAKILPAGSILLSSRATVGECSITQKDCTTNQGFQNLIPKKGINNEFLYYLAQTQKRHFIKYASGSTFLEISNSEIKKTKCAVPGIEEQTEIATFLSAIDKKIEVQNKIISDLKVLKKELMDYILNTCGFMELSIKDLIDCGFARIIKASEMKKFNGTRKYLSTSSIGENGIEQVESIITYTDRPSRASMLPIKGSIWFAKMKNSVKVYQSTDNDENHYILSTGFYGLLCDETKVNSRWIIELFKSDYFNTQKDKFSEGSSMSGIKDSQLADITLKVFADKKQEKYHTNNIQNLSKKIQLEKNALQVLLKQKQFFLNAMFI